MRPRSAIVILACLLLGCGNKGDLFLPEPTQEPRKTEEQPEDEDGLEEDAG